MRNIGNGEKKKEKIGENTGSLTSLLVNPLYGNQLQCQPSAQFFRNNGLIPSQLDQMSQKRLLKLMYGPDSNLWFCIVL